MKLNISSKILASALLTAGSIFFLATSSASAASFTVAAGNDENTDNASCSLSEAIENINNGANTNTDCSPAGAYGVDDRVNLPTGLITLTAELPQLTKSINITGQGMGQSAISGDGTYYGFRSQADLIAVSASRLKMTAYKTAGFEFLDSGQNITLDSIELDGSNVIGDGMFPGFGGVVISCDGAASFTNLYIHDFSSSGDNVNVAAIGLFGGHDSSGEVSISNSTVSNLLSTGNGSGSSVVSANIGVIDGSNTPGDVSVELKNNTFTGVHSVANGSSAISVFSIVDGGNTTVDISAVNNTMSDFSGITNLADSGIISLVAGAAQPADVVDVSYESTNNIYADSFSGGSSNICAILDGTPLLGGAGTANFNLTSQGGNLADDTSCAPYFTHAKDQNNLTNLGLTLAPLADNGGAVPTMALLQGSPAIDSGVAVTDLAQDARGSVRPQGLAYDSGAYESPFTTAVPVASVTSGSLAQTGQSWSELVFVTALLTISFVGIAFNGFVIQPRMKKR